MRIALAGNSNVGKSALFNYLTGLSQHVANWPGKTVEIAEGTTRYGNYEITVVDLPGIYSLSTFSIEEKVTEEYVIREKPDVIINVVDSMALERNLFFTIQLLELGVPMVVALNQNDLAKKRGIEIDEKKLGEILGVETVKTTATRGTGLFELLGRCMLAKNKPLEQMKALKYGENLEKQISRIAGEITKIKPNCRARYAAIRMLEDRKEINELCGSANNITELAKKGAAELNMIYKEQSPIVISNERYALAGRIAADVQKFSPKNEDIADRLDAITTHWFFGYVIMLVVLGTVFYSIFTFGNLFSGYISGAFGTLQPVQTGIAGNLLWEGIIGGFVAGLTLVLPFVLPFYFVLSLLEDSGYITRVAYLLDGFAHKIGFHGKSVIPLLLGYGCSVPACISCRIMEYDRDRIITAFAVTLIPCTARTVVILALVGTYLGIWWALGIYALNLVIVALLAKIAFKVIPGEPIGLIMEMPRYRMPSLSVVAKQTIFRTKSLLTIVFPYYMAGGFLMAILQLAGVLEIINEIMKPVTVSWLGLPELAGTLFLFGIVRKELIVVIPTILYGTTNLATIFTPVQMVVIAVVAMIYVPCIATIEALRREFGLKRTVFITIFEIVFAVILGGGISWLLRLTGWL